MSEEETPVTPESNRPEEAASQNGDDAQEVHSSERLHTAGVIADYFQIESKVLSTRSSDAFKAIDQRSGDEVLLWMLRHSLAVDSDPVKRFHKRLKQISELPAGISNPRSYGVDSAGFAFVVFPALEGFSILSGNMEIYESERRLVSCMRLIEELHKADLVCGDICGDSFWVDRDGKLSLIGLLGSFDVDVADTSTAPPADTPAFIPPEQRSGAAGDKASDIFALGVLAYRLFTGSYPYGEGAENLQTEVNPENIKHLSDFIEVPPVWAETVIRRCLSADPADRYQSASELLDAISETRNRVLSDMSSPVRVKKQEPAIPEVAPQAKPSGLQSERTAKMIVGVMIVLVVGIVAFLLPQSGSDSDQVAQTPLGAELSPHREVAGSDALRDAIDALGRSGLSMEQRQLSLQKIVNSDDPIAHDILVKSAREAETLEERQLSEKAIIERARRLGLRRSADQVSQWLRANSRSTVLPPSYEAVLRALDTTLPLDGRSSYLRQAYVAHPRMILKLAVALALDTDKIEDYHPVISQLIGDSLQLEDAGDRSSLALILAHPDLAFVFGEDVIQIKDRIPDADIDWVLNVLAERSDLNLRPIASLAAERGIMSKLRTYFLDIVRERDDLPYDVQASLIRAAIGKLEMDDIGSFGRWYDIAVPDILLAICADSIDSSIRTSAFDTLAGKSIQTEPAASLVDWIRQNHWERRASLAQAVGVISNLNRIDQESLDRAFDSFDRFVKDSNFIDIVLGTNEPRVIEIIVNRYSDMIGLAGLLQLLGNQDKKVRISAVKALKSYNDIGALRLIIDQYERERDPEVKELYRQTFWMIREREGDAGASRRTTSSQ